ncbi:MAG: alpha-1,6-mannosyltransferase [Polaribacter sp.]|jgi:alpha-1,6-mannosyltransferase
MSKTIRYLLIITQKIISRLLHSLKFSNLHSLRSLQLKNYRANLEVNFLLLSSFLLIALTAVLGFQVQQSDFTELIAAYFPFFFIYLFIFYKSKDWKTVQFFLVVSILLRFLLVFAFPSLSDDIYRFVWDGRLLLNGVNPFDQLPSAYIGGAERIIGLDEVLYQELNSPDYFTIYPPVCQAIFAGACWLFPTSLVGTAMVMKFVFLLFEVGSIVLMVKLLRHFGLPEKNALIYALNPLIILELVGNLHFEAAMVFFLLLAIWCLVKLRWQWSAVAMALSIASKLLPLLFLPFLIRRLGWRKSFWYFTIVGAVVLLLFAPLLNGVFLSHFGDSLNLYFQKFEFNASLYYVLRWMGYQWAGYNIIQYLGPILALCSALGIFGLAFFEKEKWTTNKLSAQPSFAVAHREEAPFGLQIISIDGLATLFLFAISWYLFLTTTVHPWYLSLPLALCVFGGFRYAVLWSGLVIFTYVNYSFGEYYEVLWVVGLEYVLVVGFLFYELRKWIRM